MPTKKEISKLSFHVLIGHLFLSICLLISHFFSPHSSAEELDYIVAVVNEDVITDSALQKEMRAFEERLRQEKKPIPPTEVMHQLQKRMLETMILRQIQLQRAAQTGIKVDDDTLNTKLTQMAEFQKMDLPTFIKKIEDLGENYADYREGIRNELITQSLKQRDIIRYITITDREIENFLANQVKQGGVDSQYRLLHILIAIPEAASPEKIAENKQKALDVLAELKKGADFQQMAMTMSDSGSASEGGDLGWRDSGSIPSLLAEAVVKMAVGDIVSEPIFDSSGFHIVQLVDKRGVEKSVVTQTKMRHILISTNQLVSDVEAKSKLADLKMRIQGGEDFAELARSHSEDNAASVDQDKIEWSTPGDFVPEFDEAMNATPEGQISEPFKTRFGWHIVQVLARRTHDNTEEALRMQATQQIKQRKIEEETENWLRRLRNDAYVEYR